MLQHCLYVLDLLCVLLDLKHISGILQALYPLTLLYIPNIDLKQTIPFSKLFISISPSLSFSLTIPLFFFSFSIPPRYKTEHSLIESSNPEAQLTSPKHPLISGKSPPDTKPPKLALPLRIHSTQGMLFSGYGLKEPSPEDLASIDCSTLKTVFTWPLKPNTPSAGNAQPESVSSEAPGHPKQTHIQS
jgi:hypothetical protein